MVFTQEKPVCIAVSTDTAYWHLRENTKYLRGLTSRILSYVSRSNHTNSRRHFLPCTDKAPGLFSRMCQETVLHGDTSSEREEVELLEVRL